MIKQELNHSRQPKVFRKFISINLPLSTLHRARGATLKVGGGGGGGLTSDSKWGGGGLKTLLPQ